MKIQKITLILILFFVAGCSVSSPKPAVVTAADEQSPLILAIEEEYRSEDQLTIQGTLTSKDYWSDESVAVVRLISLNGGEIIGEALYPLQSTEISKGDSHSFTISVSAGDITDYQLSLLWGDDAKILLSKVTPADNIKIEDAPAKESLILKDVDSDITPAQCKLGESSCEGGISITATLDNQSNEDASKIIVGVRLVTESGDELAQEEIHELDGVKIPAKSSRPLEIGIAIPAGISSVDVKAILRLVDFTLKNQQQ